MSELTRREWNRLALMGLVTAAWTPARGSADDPPSASARPLIRKEVGGVPLGVHTASFNDRSLEQTVPLLVAMGCGWCVLWRGHIEGADLAAPSASREALRSFRMNVPLEQIEKARAAVTAQGIQISGYALPLSSDFTDAEIERGIKIAVALGVDLVAGTTAPAILPRVEPFAREYRVRVGVVNDAGGPVASDADIDALLARDSKEVALVLDVGELTAANADAVAALRRHRRRIAAVQLRDRKRNGGPSVAWGQGDTPLKEILVELRRGKPYPQAMIFLDYPAPDRVDEVRRCWEFCVNALGG